MPYLEVYPLERYADKISTQLDEMLEAKPTMYNKTKDRYKDLACSLLKSVEKISMILEEQTLISENQDEFDELSHSNKIDEISDVVDDVKTQISSYQTLTSNSIITNKQIISTYAKVLEESDTCDFGWYEVNECASIIYKWFNIRFLSNNSKFRYSINQIPNWISNIIICYGYYYHNNKLPEFTSMFDNWFNDVSSNGNCWALPYEVYQTDKGTHPEVFTIDAVVIGDILFDECYYNLSSTHFIGGRVFIESGFVSSVVKTKNPVLLPQVRTRIVKRKLLIEECNFTSTLEGGIAIE